MSSPQLCISNQGPSNSVASANESDFARILELLVADPEFERKVLRDPTATLSAFHLDPDELAVLQQYRRWRMIS